MNGELNSLAMNRTWNLIPRSKRAKFVGSNWIFKRNEGITSIELPRFKARLVANGFTQREGINYSNIFSPVVKHSFVQIILSTVDQFDMELDQMNVKTTFLHGNLKETILMQHPNAFEVIGK